MGSDICIGMRRRSGEIISVRSYSHVFERILVEADLVTPDEDELATLICEYRDGKGYGPLPTAPYGSGILFFDFISGTIFDGQSISWFPAFLKRTIIQTLFERPERFNIYVPYFSSRLSFSDTRDENGRFRMPDLIETSFPKAADQADLWRNAGIDTEPGTLCDNAEGEDGIVATAVIPSAESDNDFVALMLELPSWRMIRIDPRNVAEWRDALRQFKELSIVTTSDESQWNEYIGELEEWNSND
ncbi:hypothetical protein G6L37_02400 [Agrobacterium rubi]|nr:hypothetical protein [Agrobacterium rubi]NTF24246.1 hypothetical protein [Agrobacterium rubi]